MDNHNESSAERGGGSLKRMVRADPSRFFLKWKRISIAVAICGVVMCALVKVHMLFLVYGAMLAGLGIGSGCASDCLLLYLYWHDEEGPNDQAHPTAADSDGGAGGKKSNG